MSVTTYTTVNGQILCQSKDGVVSHFVSDPLGSVVMVRDTSWNTVYEAEYDPYGKVQSETGTNPSEFGYVGTLGYVKDSAFSLYVRARYLLTNLGRWLTKDPLWPSEPGFVYAGSAPTIWSDPYGVSPCHGAEEYACRRICASRGYVAFNCEIVTVQILDYVHVQRVCTCVSPNPIRPGGYIQLLIEKIGSRLLAHLLANCMAICQVACNGGILGQLLGVLPFWISQFFQSLSETPGGCDGGCAAFCGALQGASVWKHDPPWEDTWDEATDPCKPDRVNLPKARL